jgi:hypothetical protein
VPGGGMLGCAPMTGALRRAALPVAALVLGVAARCAVATLGHNYDMLSYTVVAKVLEDGANVYAATSRYNYAPPWSYVVHRLAVIASGFDHAFAVFKWELTILLTLVDIGIAAWLYERFGRRAAILFFLNPISIVISGYHRQFDNIAILLGLLAAGLAERHAERHRATVASAVLGLSLAVKHVLFAFPFWLAVKEKSLRERLVVLVLPVALFAATFLPFLSGGRAGIIRNVLLYRGFANAPLWRLALPSSFLAVVSPTLLFLAVLGGLGLWLRRRDPVESLLLYLAALVAFSPTVANQSLAIPAATVAVFPNPLFAAFVAVASLHLLVDHQGLDLAAVQRVVPPELVGYTTQMVLLLAGLVWLLLAARSRRPAQAATPVLQQAPPGSPGGQGA